MAVIRTLTLKLDHLDYDEIQRCIGIYQKECALIANHTIVPSEDSDLPGAILAEICRSWFEYREIWSHAFDAGRDSPRGGC